MAQLAAASLQKLLNFTAKYIDKNGAEIAFILLNEFQTL
jgi:hypothetical protein